MSQTGKCTKCGDMKPIRSGTEGRCSDCEPVRYERIISGIIDGAIDDNLIIRSGLTHIQYPLHSFPFSQKWIGENLGKHITMVVNTVLEVDDE